MNFVLQPWQLLIVMLAGWFNRRQQTAIEYLRTENQVLKEKLGSKRILLNDDQRRLAVKGKVLGRKLLSELATIVTRHHPALAPPACRRKMGLQRTPHARPTADAARSRRTRAPPGSRKSHLGYDHIQGGLANLGHDISDTTVGNILKEHGIEPAPDRKRQTTWKTFLKAHWDVLVSVDFTTIEVWTRGGLVTYYLLFVMEVATRRVHFAGCIPNPDDPWMQQVARNLTDGFDGFLNGKKYLIMDRDTKYSQAFCRTIEDAGISCLKLPPRSPNLSPHIERFMRSLKSEALSRLIFFGEDSLRRAVREFLEHYHLERNHQGLDDRIISPGIEVGSSDGVVACLQRLGGMLRYHRPAA